MKQVEKKHYEVDYESKRRFASYWHQIDETLRTNPSSLLEIGKGSGFFSSYIKNNGLDITTLDIAADLKPDIVASVLSMPLPASVFDTVVCCQVLEHLPFDDFLPALKEIRRVARNYVVISLPQKEPGWYYAFHIPVYGRVEFMLEIPSPIKNEHVFNGEHYWEIGKRGYPLRRITDEMKKASFKLHRTFRVPENSYHRFFVLEV
ncbi:MAG: class I SAM-dependent methyltransferase [Chromatiales bacterium]|jgi:ubiquinone/menaquinone biosynthesis C-methylase UbiE